MATTKYAQVQLMDELNKPISPKVDVTSIYSDVSTKKAINIMYGVSTSTYSDSDIKISDVSSYDNEGTFVAGPTYDIADPSYLVTSVIHDGSILNVSRVRVNDIMKAWFEDSYMQQHLGEPVYYKIVSGNATEFTAPVAGDCSYIYETTDFNTLNLNLFGMDDKYPRVADINPSQDYVVVSEDVSVYGFSGDDTPQFIEMTHVSEGCWRSVSRIGVTLNLTDAGESIANGLLYHIIFKRS